MVCTYTDRGEWGRYYKHFIIMTLNFCVIFDVLGALALALASFWYMHDHHQGKMFELYFIGERYFLLRTILCVGINQIDVCGGVWREVKV